MPGSALPQVSSGHADHERLFVLINSMTDGVLGLDGELKVTLSNGVALNILDANAISDRAVDEVVNLTDKNGNKILLSKEIANAANGFTQRDWRVTYGDGTSTYVYLSVAPVRLGFGNTENGGYVVLLRDITREKSLEEEREEFISVASHELRTPVAVAEGNISNALMLAQRDHLSDEVAKVLNNAHDQITFLANMLNDLSTLSRAEQGKLAMLVEELDADDLVSQLVHDYRPSAQAKGLTLSYEGSSTLGRISTSKLYVREILQNFITNAIKYTEKGGVTLSAQAKDSGIEFSVRDSGIGVGRSDHSKLFDKFFRSSDFRVKKINGTGLGLYVTSKLARLVGGKISFDSELNRGSTFRVFVPSIKQRGRLAS